VAPRDDAVERRGERGVFLPRLQRGLRTRERGLGRVALDPRLAATFCSTSVCMRVSSARACSTRARAASSASRAERTASRVSGASNRARTWPRRNEAPSRIGSAVRRPVMRAASVTSSRALTRPGRIKPPNAPASPARIA
jgi:hypothetical protein